MAATCTKHEGVDAVTTCKRCGGFMCEGCTLHGTEDRCLTCRPKRTREEKDERRTNALRRSEWMHCEACGYVGPHFEKLGPPEAGDVLPLIVLPMMFCVLGLVLSITSAVRGFSKTTCPQCDMRDALWPAPKTSESLPDVWVQAEQRQREDWLARRRTGLLLTVLLGTAVTVVGALALFGMMRS
ncbi:MAG: hypothetical protein ABTQ32_39880 [Myxococcaceae bacterium]